MDENGQMINSYFTSFTNAFTGDEDERMNCRCARDASLDLTSFSCTPQTGNYELVQRFYDNEFCVDRDGYQFTASYSPAWLNGEDRLPCLIPNCKDRVEQCTGGPDPASICKLDCTPSC